MPVVNVTPVPRSDDALIDRIAAAMMADAHKAGEPQVYLSASDRRIPGKHVYVVWALWGDAEAERRAEIVYDAYARVAPQDIANITLAMGVTPAEWRRLGLAPVMREVGAQKR